MPPLAVMTKWDLFFTHSQRKSNKENEQNTAEVEEQEEQCETPTEGLDEKLNIVKEDGNDNNGKLERIFFCKILL